MSSRSTRSGQIPWTPKFNLKQRVFCLFENILLPTGDRESVWYPGTVTKVPIRQARRYTIFFDDKTTNWDVPEVEIFLFLPADVAGILYVDDATYTPFSPSLPMDVAVTDAIREIVPDMVVPVPIPVVAPSIVSRDDSLPSLAEVVQRDANILRRVPKHARPVFAKAFNQLCYEVTSRNDILAWTCYFMFASTVLHAPKRSGKKHKNRNFVIRRIENWMGVSSTPYVDIVGNRVLLWRNTVVDERCGTSNPIKRAKRFLLDGQYSKACNALAEGDSMAPLTDATFNTLLSKHPAGSPIPRPHSFPSHAKISPDAVADALKMFSVGSGAGLSRLRPDHLKDAANNILQTSVYESLSYLCNLLSSGRALMAVQPFITGAFLSALTKKCGGIRPVACGDVLRRIVGRALAKSVQEESKEFFSPLQMGVAVPSGAEAVVHAWRECLEAHKDDPEVVILKVDLDNAYNNGDRSVMLEETAKHFPSLYAFAWYCYGNPSQLLVRGLNKFIPSQQGTQQGCPLGCILFCLLIQAVVSKIVNELALEIPNLKELINLNVWYIDDGSIAGKYWIVKMIYDRLLSMGPKYGVFLSTTKSELAWTSGVAHPNDPFPVTMKRYRDRNVDILGAPIGDASHCNKWTVDRAFVKTKAMIDKLPDLEDAQSSYLLLRYCLSFCRMVYYLRVIPSHLLSESTLAFDDLIFNAFLSVFTYKVSDSSHTQIQLKISNGGLGLRSSTQYHSAAYFASLGNALSLVSEMFSAPLCHSVSLLSMAKLDITKRIGETTFSGFDQSIISNAIDDASFARLRESLPIVDRARLLAASAPHASAFLSAIPSDALGLKMSNKEWNAAVAVRIGVQIFPREFDCKCGKKMDVFGRHALRCGSSGDRTKRHNLLRNFFFKKSVVACLEPILEPMHLLRNCGLKPADWCIPEFNRSKPLACDVAVTDPLRDDVIAFSSVTQAEAAQTYGVKVKEAKYSHLISKEEIIFKPIIVETYGAWNSHARDFFKYLARNLVHRDFNAEYSFIINSLYQCASVILQKCNARMILNRSKSLSLVADSD